MIIKKFNESKSSSLHNDITDEYLDDVFQDIIDAGGDIWHGVSINREIVYPKYKRVDEYHIDGTKWSQPCIAIRINFEADRIIKIDVNPKLGVPAVTQYIISEDASYLRFMKALVDCLGRINGKISSLGYNLGMTIGSKYNKPVIDLVIR